MRASVLNIVISCPDGEWTGDRWVGPPQDLARFYAELLGMRIVRQDWLIVARDARATPRLAFDGEPSGYEPPRWPDPDHPQQLHLDIAVADLPAAEATIARLGARQLQDRGAFRTYADPAGHPFCLFPSPSAVGVSGGRIERIVFDCPDPGVLAAFYAELLDLRTIRLDPPDRVTISRAEGQGSSATGDEPALAFQRVRDHRPPRWPDPAYPQQIHLDIDVDDGDAACDLAEHLGATRLQEMGGSCPVYADPAGHPFCLCAPDQ